MSEPQAGTKIQKVEGILKVAERKYKEKEGTYLTLRVKDTLVYCFNADKYQDIWQFDGENVALEYTPEKRGDRTFNTYVDVSGVVSASGEPGEVAGVDTESKRWQRPNKLALALGILKTDSMSALDEESLKKMLNAMKKVWAWVNSDD